MKKAEIRLLEHDELQDTITAEQENLRRLRFAHAISPIENPMRIQHSRRLIARLKTEQRMRALKSKHINEDAKEA